MLAHTLSTILLVLTGISWVSASVTFLGPNGTSLLVNSTGYFDYRTQFSYENCLLTQVGISNTTTNCTFLPARPIRGFNPRGPYLRLNYSCTAVVLSLGQANIVGCDNVAQSVQGIRDSFVPTLEAVGQPSNTVVIMVLNDNFEGDIGGPITTAYMSHQVGVPDGLPALDMVFIPTASAQQFASRFRNVSEIGINVASEPGPWNDVFLSTGYNAYRWIFFALNCLMVVLSLIKLAQATAQGSLRIDQRTLVFIGGLISTIMVAVGLTLRRPTQLWGLLDLISSFIFSMAFFLLLTLWSGILSQVQKRSAVIPLRVGIYLAMLIAVFTLVAGIIFLTVIPTSGTRKLYESTRYITPASQLLVGLLFLFYAIRFQLRKNSYNTSKDTRRALTKLAWLAIVGFISFVIKAVANFVGSSRENAGIVSTITALYIAVDVANLLRGFAILMILGVRLPDQRSTVTSSIQSRTVRSWGGWSRGWKRALGVGSRREQSGMTSSMNHGATSSGLISSTGFGGSTLGAKSASNRASKQSRRMSALSQSTLESDSNMTTTPTTNVTLQPPKY